MAATQDERILRLTTPLAENFLLINGFTANEAISSLFEVQATLLHEETTDEVKPTEVDINRILGKPVNIEVTQPDGTTRHFNGICNRFTQGNRDARFTYYQMTIVPAVWVLTQVSRSRIFQHKSVPEILETIFEGFDVKMQLDSDYKPRNYCVQYRESDFDFASRLMEEEGIYYFFAHTGDGHQMVLADTPQSHKDLPGMPEIEFVQELQGEGFQAVILSWTKNYELRPGKVSLRDHHFQLPTNTFDAGQPSIYNVGGNQDLEVYDFPGGYARKYDNIDRGGGERQDLSNVFPDKQRTAEALMASIDVGHKVAAGQGNCSAMTSGNRFKLKNHPSDTVNGQYVITSVSHSCDQSPDYVSDEVNDQPYSNNFTCLAFGDRNPVFRPQQKTPRPVVQGAQTAVVVGPAGEEIFVDKYGRVKVQFHWDREGRYDAASSCWLRVSEDLAGKKWGSMHIPRVGQEVVVDFMEGDPDQPIIVGSVYNAESMPHYDLPKYKTLTYIKTRTSPDDGKGFNELRFEDKANKEQVFIRSQKRYDLRARGSMYETCGGNRQEVIGMRTDNEPGGNLAISVGGNYDLHVKGDQFIGIDGGLYEGVKGDVAEEYKGKQQTVISGKCEINAQEITLEALTKISLKVGGSFITIDLTGVTISGPIVKVNSGGAAAGTSSMNFADPLDAEHADTGEPGYLDRPRTGGGGGGRRWRTVSGQHAPPFQTTTLPDGSVRVGNGMIIRPSATNPNFQNEVLADLTEMSNHPAGMDTLNSINNSGHTVGINETAGGNATNFANNQDAAALGQPALGGGTGTGNGTDSEINYNRTPRPTSADPSINRPGDVALHHELAHADDGAHARDDDTPDPAHPGQAIAESNVIDRDNEYRDSRGIPRRRDHSTL
jgi:type VI secretion system secreted protein VgrG